jgi:antitoxin MazE
MKTRIVRIGNSQGIRIPKSLMEAAGLLSEVNLTTRPGVLMIRPTLTPRVGWAEAFQAMAEHENDKLIDDSNAMLKWDTKEWEWQ